MEIAGGSHPIMPTQGASARRDGQIARDSLRRVGARFGMLAMRVSTLIAVALFAQVLSAGDLPRCLYVSSYHAGYEWNDNIERGMEPPLAGKCELRKFYMDGKRQLDPGFAEDKARQAKALIDEWKPHVVIAADDNASKYLVVPYLKGTAVPVVFCGINWTAEPYGYPYPNATGMIEVGPLEPLAAEVRAVVKTLKRGVFLSADEITQHKEFQMSRRLYGRLGIQIRHVAVRRQADWEAGFIAAQRGADFVIVGNSAGIADWDPMRARRVVREHGRRFSVAYLEWMAPYAMLTMAKIADEQGEWAGKSAALILAGTAPSKIPVVANRRWNMYVNPPLLQQAGFRLSPEIMRKAMKVE